MDYLRKNKPPIDVSEWRQIEMGPNDRAIMIGRTGCGKTTLGKYFVEDYKKPYSIVYDAKISQNIGNWNGHQQVTSWKEYLEYIDEWDEYPRIIYRPTMAESLSAEYQEAFFANVYERQNCRLYIDEAYAVLGGTNPSFHLQAILSRGRERGISTIIATQRPKRIPLVFKSEVEHMYIFSMNLQEDILVVSQNTDIDPYEIRDLENYQFIYYNCLTGRRSQVLKLNLSGATPKPSTGETYEMKNNARTNNALVSA
jgi:hypothetical protein